MKRFGMIALCLAAWAGPAAAQSAQQYSVQVSFLATTAFFDNQRVSGVGFEPQFRLNRVIVNENGAFSVGVGAQYTTHGSGNNELNISGFFVEPRFAFVTTSERYSPYVSGRIAFLHQSNNFAAGSSGTAFGAGGGVVVGLTPRLNFDAGVALVTQSFSDAKRNGSSGMVQFGSVFGYAAKVGFNLGL